MLGTKKKKNHGHKKVSTGAGYSIDAAGEDSPKKIEEIPGKTIGP
jgi:hypothetical protein